MSGLGAIQKPDQLLADLRRAFEATGVFSPEDAETLAARWPIEWPEHAAETASALHALGLPAFRIVEWHRVSIELKCTHLAETWVKQGWSPAQVICLAWACERTTGWSHLAMWAWAQAGLSPRRAVGYAAAWLQPFEAMSMGASNARPSDETLRVTAAMRDDFPFPGSC